MPQKSQTWLIVACKPSMKRWHNALETNVVK
jgi:hypothetical protein